MHLHLLGLANVLGVAHAVTIYGQTPLGVTVSGTQTAADSTATTLAAYNTKTLQAPALPDPKPANEFVIQLQNGGTPGVSIPQEGSFFGFSIEMSVTNQVLGKNASHIQVPFLNLMANLQKRAGGVKVRVGGNTQETATLVDSLADGRALEKDLLGVSNPTQTPPLLFTPEILYMMRNISSFVNVRWFLGIPFNDTAFPRLGIASVGSQILGDYLIGLQAGNEPDLYARHGHRPETYQPQDYVNELQGLLTAMSGDEFERARQMLIIPNLAFADWTPDDVWNTGVVDQMSNNLAYLAMEKYPADNCAAQFNTGGTPVNPQDIFPSYLDHTSGQRIVAPYLNSTSFAMQKNKKLLMFETNTGSCGGFPGVSDSFGAALWGLDYSMQMAFGNFSGAMFHIGGQNVFYNPFTSPPTNETLFHQWSIGPIYYSALVMAEALGPSNKSQIFDLNANSGDVHTPAYSIYEDGNPVRVMLFNYMTDPTGASDYTAQIAIGGSGIGQPNASPAQVKVKYLRAASVSQIGNITWAGQTFGDHFQSDGRLMGDEDIQTVACDQTTNLCSIKVPAPSVALVFLTDDAFAESQSGPFMTFSTTAFTKTINTASVDPTELATSNGRKANGRIGSTSPGSTSGGWAMKQSMPGVTLLVAIAGDESSQAAIDDNDTRIHYSTGWTLGGSSHEFNQTTHGTNIAGAAFSFSFNGTGIMVFGTIDADQGTGPPNSTYVLDGVLSSTFTAPKIQGVMYHVPFYESLDLPYGEHLLVGSCEDGGSQIFLDYLVFSSPIPQDLLSPLSNVTTATSTPTVAFNPAKPSISSQKSPPATSGTPSRIITGAVLGAVGLTMLVVVVVSYIRYRRRKSQPELQPEAVEIHPYLEGYDSSPLPPPSNTDSNPMKVVDRTSLSSIRKAPIEDSPTQVLPPAYVHEPSGLSLQARINRQSAKAGHIRAMNPDLNVSFA
ncbi:hypothetical protein ONZ45_g12847 [Pleurotus djamor]|nr:hypothetical protein ONZ45_g12847 [Pleurotus djamor]